MVPALLKLGEVAEGDIVQEAFGETEVLRAPTSAAAIVEAPGGMPQEAVLEAEAGVAIVHGPCPTRRRRRRFLADR